MTKKKWNCLVVAVILSLTLLLPAVVSAEGDDSDISECSVSITGGRTEDGVYTEPEISVFRYTEEGNEIQLIEGEDFLIAGYYQDPDSTNPFEGNPYEDGDCFVLLEGIGSYSGLKSFYIEKPFVAGTQNDSSEAKPPAAETQDNISETEPPVNEPNAPKEVITEVMTGSEETEPGVEPDKRVVDKQQKLEKSIIDSGECGDGLTWELAGSDEENLTLSIAGTGEMEEGWDDYYNRSPWHNRSDAIREITIGEGVGTISSYAFYDCIKVTSISIPNTVRSIGKNALSECRSLSSITIPDSVTAVGGYAFSACENLSQFEIPDSVRTIGGGAFSGCIGLDTIVIPDSVKYIDYGLFSGCTSLKSVSIPNSITSIGSRAFSGCKSLGSITIPDSVTSIEEYAFSNCIILDNVVIPDSVTTISEGVFSGCTGLASITIPDTVRYIRYNAFSGCTGLGSIVIPEGVVELYSSVFSDCTGLNSIILPSSLYELGSYVFSGCTSLCSITIPGIISDTGSYVFSNCENLTDVTISGKIGSYAFSGCGNLEQVNVPHGYISVYDHAFSGCRKLKTVETTDIQSVGAYAFEDCEMLTEIGCLNAESIDEYAFLDCVNLSNVTLSNQVKTIITGAFRNCSSQMRADFYGTQSEWQEITIKSYNDPLVNGELNCRVPVGTIEITVPDGYDTCFVGDSFQARAVFKPGNAFNQQIKWTVSDPTVLKVDQSGRVTVVGKDNEYWNSGAYLYASSIYGGVRGSSYIYVRDEKELNASMIQDIKTQTYSGKALTPAVVLKDGGRTLKKGTDYTVSYKDNVNVGYAEVRVTGKGHYYGTASRSFSIKEKAITPTVILSRSVFIYNGLDQRPNITVKDGNKVLSTADYEIWFDNISADPGTYTATVQLQNNYLGSKNVTYQILRANNPMKVKAKSPSLKASKVKKKNQKIAAKKAFQVSGAQGSITYKKLSGNKKITVAKNGKITVKKGAKKGTYKLKVLVTDSGGGEYKPVSRTVTVTIQIK